MWRNGSYEELFGEEIFRTWNVKGIMTLYLPMDSFEISLEIYFLKITCTPLGKCPIIILWHLGTTSYKWRTDQVEWTFLGNDSVLYQSLWIKCPLFEWLAMLNLTLLSQVWYTASHSVDHKLRVIKWRFMFLD